MPQRWPEDGGHADCRGKCVFNAVVACPVPILTYTPPLTTQATALYPSPNNSSGHALPQAQLLELGEFPHFFPQVITFLRQNFPSKFSTHNTKYMLAHLLT